MRVANPRTRERNARIDPPTPEKVFETLTAYQRTAAPGAAIDLDVFTAIGRGIDTIESGGTTAAGVSERFHTIPGNAFEVDRGHDYDPAPHQAIVASA